MGSPLVPTVLRILQLCRKYHKRQARRVKPVIEQPPRFFGFQVGSSASLIHASVQPPHGCGLLTRPVIFPGHTESRTFTEGAIRRLQGGRQPLCEIQSCCFGGVPRRHSIWNCFIIMDVHYSNAVLERAPKFVQGRFLIENSPKNSRIPAANRLVGHLPVWYYDSWISESPQTRGTHDLCPAGGPH